MVCSGEAESGVSYIVLGGRPVSLNVFFGNSAGEASDRPTKSGGSRENYCQRRVHISSLYLS